MFFTEDTKEFALSGYDYFFYACITLIEYNIIDIANSFAVTAINDFFMFEFVKSHNSNLKESILKIMREMKKNACFYMESMWILLDEA